MIAEHNMDAVVIAGGIPRPDDPLYPYSRGQAKTLIEVAGRPMAQWVLDALGGARSVGNVVVVGLAAGHGLACTKPTDFVPDQGGLLANAKAGLWRIRELNPDASHALVVSGDIPSITSQMVDWRVERAREADADLDYVAIERKVMEARFPGADRSYLRLKDVEVCGGDMNVARVDLVTDDELWERIIAARKSVLRQAALIGFDTLLLVVTRRLTLQRAARMVCQRMGLEGRVHLCPYAEVGMDIDKPHQLKLLRSHLASSGPRA